MVGSLSRLRKAYNDIKSKNPTEFVYLPELARLSDISDSTEFKNILDRLKQQKKAVFSGTNIAVMNPRDKQYTYTLPDGTVCALVKIIWESEI